jgi:hypothetical protein
VGLVVLTVRLPPAPIVGSGSGLYRDRLLTQPTQSRNDARLEVAHAAVEIIDAVPGVAGRVQSPGSSFNVCLERLLD